MGILSVLLMMVGAQAGVYAGMVSDNRIFQMSVELDPKPVTVDLYYESLCPGCRYFVETQLYPTYYKLKMAGIMQIRMFPYGNAKQSKKDDGTWKFDCQHGHRECVGNILEACIISHLNNDFTAYLPVLACMEGGDDPVTSAKGCVSALSKLDYNVVRKCAKGSEGNALMHQMGVATESLAPPHNYVPWVVVNGVHNNTVQNQALTDLTGLICQSYQGEKPRQCTM